MKKPVKTKKTIRKTVKKRRKAGFKGYSEALRAFLLVGVLVAISALISCAVIMVHSSMNNDNEAVVQEAAEDTQKTEPAISVVIEPAPAAVPVEPQPVSAARRPSREEPPAPAATTVSAVITPRPPVENRGTLVFVIDDAGNNMKEIEPFLRIPGPLTIAVLPGLPNSAETAKRIRESGKEVILHQPMEAIGAQDPGPSAIYSGMSVSEIRAVLAKNLAEVGPVTGMNNHQGSKITSDREIMQTILAFCAEHNIYFLDSRTTAETVVPVVAGQMGLKIAERNIFIDNEQNKDAMLRYIFNGLTRAQRSGSAVMIGHAWSPDLAPLLAEQFPLFVEQGYTIKTASDIIK